MKEIAVLLIDDDPGVRLALADFLSMVAQFRVAHFCDGSQALDHLEAHWQEYTAILLDYVLAPPLTGEQVLLEIRRRYPRLSVIVYTGSDPVGGVEALAKGAYRYMRQPIHRAELVNIVRNLAEQDQIFFQIARDMRQMLRSDICLAWRLDRRTHCLRVAAWDSNEDLDKQFQREIVINPDDPAIQKFFTDRRPLYLRDVTDPRSAPRYFHREEAKKREWTSLISIPLIRQQRVIGLVDSYTHNRLVLSEEQRQLWIERILPAFAVQAAEAVRNAELSDQLQVLRGFNEVVAGAFEENTILRQIQAKALELVGGDVGWLLLKDEETNKLILKDCVGLPSEMIGYEQEIGEGVAGIVAMTGEALHIADVSQDMRHESVPGIDVKSEIAVPLRREEQLIGVLTVMSHFPDAFTDDDVNLLTALAAQAAIVIERTSLTRHSQEVSRLALTGDFDILAKYVVKAVSALTGADVILWMASDKHEAQGALLRIQAISRQEIMNSFPADTAIPIAPGSSVTGQALREGHPIIVQDMFAQYDQHEKLDFHAAERRQGQGWRAFMTVPLLGQGGRPLGSLSLYSKQVAKFGAPDAESMQTFANQVAVAFENVQIMQKLDRQLESLHRVVQSQSLDEVLDQTLEGVNSILGSGTSSSINLYDATSDTFDLSRATGPLKIMLEVPPRADGTGRYVLKAGQPLYLDDVKNPPAGRPTIRDALHEVNPFRSFAALPLKGQERTVGVLFVNCQTPVSFSAALRRVLELFAGQAAIAIENTQLLKETAEETRRRVSDIEALAEINEAVVSEKPFETLQLIVDKAIDVMPGDYSSLWLKEADTDDLILQAVHPPKGDIDEDSDESDTGISFQHVGRISAMEHGVCVRVSETGEAEICNDTGEEPEFYRIYPSAKSSVTVPLRYQGAVIGALNVESPQESAFTTQHQQLLETFANQAAIAIRNARLFEDLQERTETLSALYETGKLLTSAPDLYTVLTDVVERAMHILRADSVVLYEYDSEESKILGPPIFAGKILDPEVLQTTEEAAKDGAAWRIIQSGKSRYAADVQEDEIFSGQRHPRGAILPFVQREGIVSTAGVVLQVRDEIIGVLFVHYRSRRAFDGRERERIDLFASQAAIAIDQERQRRRRGIERVNAVSRRFNPYQAGEAIREPKGFFGRATLIQEIMDGVHSNNYIVFGERRIGKTSLLHQLKYHLACASRIDSHYYFLPTLISLEEVEEAGFFRSLIAAIIRDCVPAQENWVNWSEDANYDHRNFREHLGKVVAQLQEQHPDKKIRVVLLLDEMDKFMGYDPATHSRFRSLFMTTSGSHLKMVMAGVAVQRVQQSRTSPWYNLFTERELQPLEEIAARRLVEEPVAGYYTYDNNALRAILEYSDLKPQAIQQIGYSAVNSMLDRVSESVSQVGGEVLPAEITIVQDDVLTAVELVLREKDGEYSSYWQQLTHKQQNVFLKALTHNGFVNMAHTRDDGAPLFFREDLYNVTCRDERGKVHLSYLFSQWLQRRQSS